MPAPKKQKKQSEGTPDWMVTYGDMTTLLLTFFIFMFTTAEINGYKLQLILAAFQGLGAYSGGNTLQQGKLAELGNTVMSLPSMQAGRALDKARRAATALFEPEIKSKKVRITEDERGLVITLASDAYFRPASAELNIEASRELLQKISTLLSSKELANRKFRIEGHTGPWPSNWELSTARATNVLHYLVDFGVNENQFQVMGLGDTQPLMSNDTPEGRAYNRRVDIIVLSNGNL